VVRVNVPVPPRRLLSPASNRGGALSETEFRVLGPIEALRCGRRVPLAGPKRRTVLAALLLGRGRMVPVHRMVRLLWGDESPASAGTQVRKQISALRAEFGADRVRTWRDGYGLRIEPGELDLDRFDAAAGRGRELLGAGLPEPAAEALRSAVDLWRGPALADGTDPLIGAEADHLEELRLAAVADRLRAELDLGRHAELVGELTGLVRRYPLREALRGQLMLALHRSGRTADGLRVYREGRAELAAQLALEPGRDLRRLHRAMLADDPALAAPPAP
jgi:DNA-binding SARP family transcriptional activator